MLLGMARGKVGDLVFRRQNGQQITTPRVRVVANPKTLLQQRQRMAFATAVQAMSALRSIVDHSFEGTKYGQDSLNRFMSENVNLLRAGVSGSVKNYNIKGVTTAQLNEYVISKGSLSFVGATLETTGLRINVEAESLALLTQPITTQSQYEAALALLGCVPGDQLTFVGLDYGNTATPTEVADFNGAKNYAIYPRISRVVFVKQIPADFNASVILGDSETINPALTTRLEGVMTFVADNNSVIVNGGFSVVPCAAIIRSQELSSGVWARSNATMQVNEELLGYAEGAIVAPSYGNSISENEGSEYYLNNGLTPNPTQAGA